jgi:broad specificity phosphatase PhoE
VAVAHGGTIRAALALALGLDAERSLSFVIDNCSLTRIDHIGASASSEDIASPASWRVVTVNHPPVILDRA